MNFLRRHSSFPKILLIFYYIKLRYGFSITKSNGYKQTSIFGYQIFFNSLSGFFNIFCEIFISEDYKIDLKKKNPVIFDVGANIGLTAIYFNLLYPEAKISTFEANPETQEILLKNLEGISNIKKYQTLLSNKIQRVNFFSSSQGALGASIYKARAGINSKKIKLKTTRLSNFITKPIDLLKMDIEGSELSILKDLYKTKKIKLIRNILFEYHYIPNSVDNNLSEIIKILENSNFIFHLLFDNMNNHFSKKKFYTISIHATKIKN